MTLATGSKLGPYEIQSAIGAGGMGEVYKARDTRLDRTVAIKVLPSHLSDNPDLKQRFEREARAVAALSHPHICTLHDIGNQNGLDFLVMEYIEGETVAARLQKGPIPLDQAIRIAIEISDALDKAHRQGVIHRDLKPGNIMLTKLGAKLLDFGLAKLRGSESPVAAISTLPTQDVELTARGTILGTLQYMAPEQLEGKEADARTDIFAFGTLVYEMVTGKKAFEGKSQASLIAAIIERNPQPMSELQALTPLALDQVIRTCMAKDPAERWQTAGDIARQLKWIAAGSTPAVAPALGIAPRRRMGWPAAAIAGVLLGGAVTGWLMWTFNRPIPPSLQRLSIVPAQDAPVAFYWNPGLSLAISPDGTRVAYVGAGKKEIQLFVRSLNESAVRAIPGTEGAVQPFFSPDGQWIAFFTETELKKVALGGGNPITLSSKLDGGIWCFGEWGEDDVIVFSNGSLGLRRISADGGKAEQLSSVKNASGEGWHSSPAFIPGTRYVLFDVQFSLQRDPRIEAIMLDTGDRRAVVENGYNPHYLRSGHLLFQRDNTILIAPFDAKRLTLIGPAVPLIDEVRRDGQNSGQTIAQLAVSWNGTLAYVPAVERGSKTLGWVNRDGKFQTIGLLPNSFDYPRLSPGGKQLAFELQRGQEWEVHVYDLMRGTTTRLTQAGTDRRPAWRPNGTELAVFSVKSDARGMYLKNRDGSERLLLSAKDPGELLRPGSWSPDGTLLAYTVQKGSQHDIWILSMGDKPAAHPYLNSAASEYSPMFSPDGRWLAYVSDESGREEVYVRRFPKGEKFMVSTGGGVGPVWRRDGKELFYHFWTTDASNKMYGVSAAMKNDTILLGSPNLLFDAGQTDATGFVYSLSSNWGPSYDAGQDGRLIMVKGVNPLSTREIVLVQNWFTELAGKTH